MASSHFDLICLELGRHQYAAGLRVAASLLDVLDEHYPEDEAERQFTTAVDWGRYAELFESDADDGLLRLTE